MDKEHYSIYSCMKIICLSIFLFIISFLFLTESPLHIWINSDASADSSVFMTIAMMMHEGYVPYRDTFDHKGPLIYLINYIGRFIAVYRGVWIVEFASLFMTFLLMYKIARLKCSRILSCIALLMSVSLLFTFFEGGNLVEEYAMPFIAGALFIFLDYFINLRISKIRLIACGLCLGGVCLLRPNMIATWIVFCVAALIKFIADRNFGDLKKFTVFFILGFLIIVLPIVLWLVINNSFIDFWNDYISFNIIYSASNNAARWRAFFSFYNKPMIIFASIISVYMLFNGKSRFLYGTYFGYLFLSLIFIGISGREFPHYGIILVPAVVFPIASLFDICTEDISSNKRKTVTFLVALYFLYTLIAPVWLSIIYELPGMYKARKEDRKPWLVNEVCRIVSDNTQHDDTISVYGNWDIIYILSDRRHATKYSYQFPIGWIKPEIMQNYFAELKEQLPSMIVVQENYNDDEIKDFLDNNNYSLIWMENEGGGVIIYMLEN